MNSSSKDEVVSRCVKATMDYLNKHVAEPLTTPEWDIIEDALNDSLNDALPFDVTYCQDVSIPCEVNVIQRGLDIPSFLQPVMFQDER